MDLSWLFRNKKDFLDFVQVLNEFDRDRLFQTIYVQALTDEFWMKNLKKIMLRTFLPWVIYSILSVVYFAYSLNNKNQYI